MSQNRYKPLCFGTALAVLTALVIFPPVAAMAAGISGFSIRIPSGQSNPPDQLLVSAKVAPGSRFLRDLQDGMQKRLIFYVDIFRKWHSWPDEFVLGTKIERRLECDNVKGEYTLTTSEAGKTRQTRYKNCNGVMGNAFILKNVKLSDLKELTSGKYIVRVTAESKAGNMAPILGQIFFFIQDYEFKAVAESGILYLGTKP